ncbi:hypothetical protein [Allokutzneria sp. NRRL B-24872]|uniref:hypothetical protein n=1 Tax=Allokutzneria sp. NRRL B-24872 TaxID=1137961 RepID=UPI000A36B868|nr:hypothetical protein [Allokutzneria sp. NRRL B-24872]
MAARENHLEIATELLRAAKAEGAGAIELVEALRERLGDLSTIMFVASFGGAFGISVKVLMEAHTWQGFHGPGPLHLTDEQFVALLARWV